MQILETITILQPGLNEQVIKREINKATKLLQQYSKVKQVKVKDIGEKKLAYDVKSYSYGYYITYTWVVDGNDDTMSLSEVERFMRTNDYVLKFIATRLCSDHDDDFEYTFTELNDIPNNKNIDAYDVLFGLKEYIKERSYNHEDNI